jgi:hypothetical protein
MQPASLSRHSNKPLLIQAKAYSLAHLSLNKNGLETGRLPLLIPVCFAKRGGDAFRTVAGRVFHAPLRQLSLMRADIANGQRLADTGAPIGHDALKCVPGFDTLRGELDDDDIPIGWATWVPAEAERLPERLFEDGIADDPGAAD